MPYIFFSIKQNNPFLMDANLQRFGLRLGSKRPKLHYVTSFVGEN